MSGWVNLRLTGSVIHLLKIGNFYTELDDRPISRFYDFLNNYSALRQIRLIVFYRNLWLSDLEILLHIKDTFTYQVTNIEIKKVPSNWRSAN